jgi:hypothetical protein
MNSKDYGPQQLFLTSHSPAFDGEENFFAVDMQERRSGVTRRPREERFQATGGPPQTLEEMQAEYQQRREPEAWVSREGLVRLPERVRQDIGLRQGRMAYFVKNEQGRWELLTSDDMEKLFPREERE